MLAIDTSLHMSVSPVKMHIAQTFTEGVDYSATREDDTTFIFSHFGLFLSDAASNAHK